jgi:hypothetical protein
MPEQNQKQKEAQKAEVDASAAPAKVDPETAFLTGFMPYIGTPSHAH